MFKILRLQKVDKGSLLFTVDISVEKWGGFCIHGITIFQKEGKRWIGFPSKKIEVGTGEVRYLPYVRFEERTIQEAFGIKLMQSIDAWLKAGNKPTEYEQKPLVPQAPRPAYGPASGNTYADEEPIPF